MIPSNWKTIIKETKNDPTKVVNFFNEATNPTMKMSSYVKRILLSKSRKDSFLLNNKEFCKSKELK